MKPRRFMSGIAGVRAFAAVWFALAFAAAAQEAGVTAPIGSADEQDRRYNARRHRASAAYLELKGKREEALKEYEASLKFLDDPAIRKKVDGLARELAAAGSAATSAVPASATNAPPPAPAAATNAAAGPVVLLGIAAETPAVPAATNAPPPAP